MVWKREMNRALTRQEGTRCICVDCGELVSNGVPIIENTSWWSNDPGENAKQVDLFNRLLTEARQHYADKHSDYWALRCADHDETKLMPYKKAA